MDLRIALAFFAVGLIVWLGRKTGLFHRHWWYRHLPKFFFANGAGFLIPLHIYADGLVLFVLWLIWSEWKHHRQKKNLAKIEVLPE